MDVDGFQESRPEIGIFVRYARRADQDLAGHGFMLLIADDEQRPSRLDDEGLGIGMGMELGSMPIALPCCERSP